MADDIEAKFSIRPELIKGSNGVFEVVMDNEPLYSKKATGRFPEPGEVEELIGKQLQDQQSAQ